MPRDDHAVERAVRGDEAEKLVLPGLHRNGLRLVEMVVAEQVQQAVDEQQATLVRLGGPEGRGLTGDVGGREHDVAKLAGLAGGEGRVVGPLALERDHVRRAVDAAPLEVDLAHAPLAHQGDGDHARTRHALVLEDLGSTNGTLVNGHVIDQPVTLREDDEVQVGDTIMRVTRG